MATLYISEFTNAVSSIGTTKPQVPPQPSSVDQTVDITSGSLQSDAFSSRTNAVLLVADEDCSIAFGDDPTATTDNLLLPAKVPMMFGVWPGMIAAVIAAG